MAYVENKGLNKKGQAVFRIYIDGPKKPDGSRNQKRETVKIDLPTRKMKPEDLDKWIDTKGRDKAMDQAKAREREINQPGYKEPTKETFSEHVDRWLKVHGETIQPKTLHRYKELLNRILPYIGHVPVQEIQMEHIEDLYRDLAKEPRKDRKEGTLSAKTIQHHARVLHIVLEYAVRRKMIASNPATYVKPETPKNKAIEYFNEDQIKVLMEILEGESLTNKCLVNLAISTGARAGELAALTWDDIDEKNRTIRINKSSQYIPGQGCNYSKEPKTEASKRTVTVSASIIFLLKQLKGEQEAASNKAKNKWINTNAVFCNNYGQYIHPEYPSHWWHKFIRQTDLPKVSFHGLRHSCASLLLSKGQSVPAVAKRLGHANPNITLAVYSHAYQKDDQINAEIMDGILNEKKPEKKARKKRVISK